MSSSSGKHLFVSLNGCTVPRSDVSVCPWVDEFLLGPGLFETIRVSGGRPVLFEEHIERLTRSARTLGLATTPGDGDLRARCLTLLAANTVVEGVLKIVWFRDSGIMSELILTRDYPYRAEQLAGGFRLATVRREPEPGPLAGHKTLNYRANLLARRAARAAGHDDALFINDRGDAWECSAANIFAVIGGTVIAPPLDAGVLPGIVRGQVLASGMVPVEERVLPLAQLLTADEVFVTNSLIGITPVAVVDGRGWDLSQFTVTRSLAAAVRP